MFVKLQSPDAHFLRVFNSTKTNTPNVGLSVAPPIKKSENAVTPKQHKKILQFPRGGNRNRSIKGRHRKIGKEVDLGSFNGGNAVIEKESVNRNTLIETPGCRKVRPNGLLRKNGDCHEICGENRGKMSSKGVIEATHTKCSTKWARYGGSVPAMLEAVETIEDLNEALKPWETTLTNKERSILLKEQAGWERAVEIFEWFKWKSCYEVNVIHYNIMFKILGKARQWPEVERLWGEMWKRGINPVNSTYGTLIDVYSKGGLVEKAMTWLDFMSVENLQPDEVTMGIVVQMYKKAGEFKMAEDFFNKWSCNKDENVFSKNTHAYNTLIDTYGKARKLREAGQTFDKMLRKGIMPTTVTFNTMIHMYGNNGQMDKVDLLMQKMKKVECSPDTRTFNILISLHAKHNNIELAAGYLNEMKKASLEPDAVSYRTLLYAFSKRRMVAEAEGLVLEMGLRKLEIDEFTQSSLTRMYIEAGLLEKSWSWFKRFHLGGEMTSDCYSANIDAFGERGYISHAERVFYCCRKAKKLTILECNVMVKAYGISKKFEQACSLFDSMGRYGLVPDRCGYNSLVQMLAGADFPDKAIVYLRKMQEVGLVFNDCSPYCAVISSYVKLGRVDMAVGLYEEMIGHEVKPDVIVFGVLINAFAETGSVNEANFYVNAMRDMGLPMNAVLCKSLIKLYTKVGYLKEAQEAYEMLKSIEPGLDLYTSNCMIDLYSERSVLSEAEEIFENLKKNGLANEFTHAMMLCMYKRNGRFVEAFRIAKDMREFGIMKDLLSYNLVLGLYACDGRYKEAVAAFGEMLKSNIKPDDSTFKSLSSILLKCGVPKKAIGKLELKRKKDAESGLRVWASTLSSVIDMDDDDDDDDDDVIIGDV